MNGLVDYGIIDPNQTNALARGYDAAVDRRNVLAQQERANKLADLQYQSAVDAVNKNRALQSFRANKNPQDKDYYAGLRMIDPALAMQEEESLGKIAETRAKTQSSEFDLQNKKLDFTLQAVGAASTPEKAIYHITQGVKNGVFSMQEASNEIAQLSNITPEGYAQYRMNALQRTLAAKDQLDVIAPKIDQMDTGSSFVATQANRFQPGYGRPMPGMAPTPKTATISERTAQGNLALAQSQEAWKRANPGYEIIQTETGSVGVNKNNPRDVVPISIDGQAVGMKPPPAKLIEVDTQLSALAGSLKAFKDEVAKRKITGAKGLFTGEDTANMTSKYTSLLMGVKDLYTLGALTGPDMGIIENQLQNPATWAGAMTSKKAFDAQIQTIEDMLRRNHINTETAFGRPLKATAKAISGLGPDASAGVITNPQFPGFSVGRR
jgi:hypothetical protein